MTNKNTRPSSDKDPRSPPLVTLGMPVYNGEKYIREALDSLIAQDYPNFRIIISDNASSDRTSAICEEFARRDSRIDYERQERNRGAAWNFNRVAEVARGEYFMWTAHDDVWHPRCVSASVAALELFREAVVCYHYAQPVGSKGQQLGAPLTGLSADSPRAVERWLRCFSHWEIHSSIYGLLRLSAMRLVRPIQCAIGSDLVFISEMALRGPIIQVPEVLSWKRVPDPGVPYLNADQMIAHLGGTSRSSILFAGASITQSVLSGLLHARLGLFEQVTATAAAIATYGSRRFVVDVKEAVRGVAEMRKSRR